MNTHIKPTAGGSWTESAFTRCDLSVALATVILILGVVLPALASSKSRSQQAICVNNLRLVGQGVLLFNLENNQLDPWWARSAGYSPALANNIFYHCMLLSNGVNNPKVFACPSDALVNTATHYGITSGGLLHREHRNAAVSYFWGLDSSALVPDSVLAGDRHILPNAGMGLGCATGLNPVAGMVKGSPTPNRWGSGLHGPAGNILLHDGRVEQSSNETLERLLRGETDDNGSIHLQLPRPPVF